MRGFHRATRRLAVGHLRETTANAFARGKLGAGFTQCDLVLPHVLLAHRFEFIQRNLDPFGVVDHLAEQVRAECIIISRSRQVGSQPVGEFLHGVSRCRVGLGKSGLQFGIFHPGENRRDVVPEVSRHATE